MAKRKPLIEKELCELGGYCMEADEMMAHAWEQASEGRLRTSREWFIRARKAIRAAIQMIEFRIDMNADEDGRGSSKAD